ADRDTSLGYGDTKELFHLFSRRAISVMWVSPEGWAAVGQVVCRRIEIPAEWPAGHEVHLRGLGLSQRDAHPEGRCLAMVQSAQADFVARRPFSRVFRPTAIHASLLPRF